MASLSRITCPGPSKCSLYPYGVSKDTPVRVHSSDQPLMLTCMRISVRECVLIGRAAWITNYIDRVAESPYRTSCTIKLVLVFRWQELTQKHAKPAVGARLSSVRL
jgi:hypothetical protein